MNGYSFLFICILDHCKHIPIHFSFLAAACASLYSVFRNKTLNWIEKIEYETSIDAYKPSLIIVSPWISTWNKTKLKTISVWFYCPLFSPKKQKRIIGDVRISTFINHKPPETASYPSLLLWIFLQVPSSLWSTSLLRGFPLYVYELLHIHLASLGFLANLFVCLTNLCLPPGLSRFRVTNFFMFILLFWISYHVLFSSLWSLSLYLGFPLGLGIVLLVLSNLTISTTYVLSMEVTDCFICTLLLWVSWDVLLSHACPNSLYQGFPLYELLHMHLASVGFLGCSSFTCLSR